MTTLHLEPRRGLADSDPLPADVERIHIVMVNAFLIGLPGAAEWTLVDAGLPFSAPYIIAAAERRFGAGTKPRAIVLSHGHFDHVGALQTLLAKWPDVPVYAPELELPYLTGRSNYPPPDPTVGGGLVARLSPLYPRKAINLGNRVRALPADGQVPSMEGWQWIFTPGHSPGHVSFFRESDRTLLAADAFSTQKQESLLGALTELPYLEGPPRYFTTDWIAARRSVEALAALNPIVAAPGHGRPMAGPMLQSKLHELAIHFDAIARPSDGRYVRIPALADETGTLKVPPPVSDPAFKLAALVTLSLATVAVIGLATRKGDRHG